jgi:hypothetical protein
MSKTTTKKNFEKIAESFGGLKISITFASAIENEGFAAVTMRKMNATLDSDKERVL